jgi:hypothetical protein
VRDGARSLGNRMPMAANDHPVGECLSCGEVPITSAGLCSRCGKRLLMCPPADPPRQPSEVVTLANAGPETGRELVLKPEDNAPDPCETMVAERDTGQSSPEPLPAVFGTLPDTPVARRWREATEAFRDELASQAQNQMQSARAMAGQAQETQRSVNVLHNLLSSIGSGWQLTGEAREIGEVPRPVGEHWARQHDRCSYCGTTQRPHRSKGLCDRCYYRVRRSASRR